MKKSIALILALVLALCCGTVFKHCSGVERENSAVTKCCNGLYKLEAAEADYSAAEKLLGQINPFSASLGSAMVTDVFAGYNFDYTAQLDTYVLQTEARGDKFAVLGLGQLDIESGLSVGNGGASAAALNALMTDGINDHGVFVALLTMTDVAASSADGSNPESPNKMNFLLCVRYLLERSQSAYEAAAELKDLNLYISEKENGCSYHLLIADKKNAFVAELVDNTLVITEGRRELTNYCLYRTVSETARGTERYTLLHKTNELVGSRWGMMKTMQSVWPTKLFDEKANNRWYSEFYGTYPEYTDEEGNALEFNANTDKETADAILDKMIARYSENLEDYFKNVHSSVYDFETGTLSVLVNESPVELQFSLNIQPPKPVEESAPEAPAENTEVIESEKPEE